MNTGHSVVVGGGAAGFLAAITAAEAAPGRPVTILERGPECLAKVRISGGGRCNVTHACFDPRELVARYPRGGRALISVFQRFQPRDTIAWFEKRGVRLKTEADGRMFPVTDDSGTIVDCLLTAAREAGVSIEVNRAVERVRPVPGGGFEVEASGGRCYRGDRLLLATGGCRSAAQGGLAVALGHTLEPPVPSLFAFHVEAAWLRALAGVAIQPVEATVPGTKLSERGALLITHLGVSGPVILRLSAWGARPLHDREYRFPLRLNWLPEISEAELGGIFDARRREHGAQLVVNGPIPPLTARLWERLALSGGVRRETRWSMLSRDERAGLIRQLRGTELAVSGRSLNKDEFVTCGGVRLGEVNLRTMESRVCPGLHLAGELLDIDAITGGFNFQSAWATGWIAGHAMATGGGGSG
jgi:hypothetical protein